MKPHRPSHHVHPQRTHLALLLAPLLTVPGAAFAQDPTGLPPVFVSGSRLPVTPSGLAQNVTVIDQRQIQESNPARIEDLLDRVLGVRVGEAGKAGGFVSLFMRGAEESHLLIMVDGVKVNDPTTTRGSAYDLSSIDVSQVERIEVLRGPASAIHGGEALAGVINIITKRSARAGISGSAYGAVGGGGLRKIGTSLAFGGDAFSAQLGAGHTRSGDEREGSLRQKTFSASARLAPGAVLEADAFVRRAERESRAFPDDSGGPRLAPADQALTLRDATDTVYGINVGGGDPATLRLQAGAAVFERDEKADNAFIAAGVRSPVPAYVGDTNFRRTTWQLTATREWGRTASVVVGVERQTEKGGLTSVGDFFFNGSPITLQFDLERKTDSLFGEARLKPLDQLTLQIGVRRDKVQGIGSETTPHLGALWDLPGGATTLKATFSKGFKPPSFFALGFPFGANPDLRPEHSRNLEFTLAHRFGGEGQSLQASVYKIDYRDMVDFLFVNNAPLFVNRGTIAVRGFEPQFNFMPLPRLRAQVGATLLDIKEKDGLAPLRSRPETRAHASLVWDIDDRASLFASASYTGKYRDRSNPTGESDMPGYTTVDLSYSRRFGALRTKVAVDNVFDEDYEHFVGFPAPGRRLRIELRAEF